MKSMLKLGLSVLILAAAAAPALAQESGISVRSIRVLANDAEASAKFYEKAFGMSETRRPVNTATFKEIVINSGSTVEKARAAKSTPIVIATKRAKDAPVPSMAALILDVPDMDKAVAAVVAAGGKGGRPNKSGEGLTYCMVADPDGNPIELLLAGAPSKAAKP
jgi:predicted enzyme related to lactoylglutathione lyase